MFTWPGSPNNTADVEWVVYYRHSVPGGHLSYNVVAASPATRGSGWTPAEDEHMPRLQL